MKRAIVGAVALVGAASCSSTGTSPAGGGTIQVTASGEALALGGFAFPPAEADQPFFVDGWAVRFTKLLVTFDDVRIARGPDTDAADPQKTGPVVARALGPWAVDLHAGGPLDGKGGEGKAIALTTVANQTENGGAPFAADEKYAFAFRVVAATAGAVRVNVAADDPDYAEMVQKGYTVLYVGNADWKGGDCSPAGDPALDALPKHVDLRLGFAAPVAYTNCQNPDLGGGGEDSPRGLFVKEGAPTVAQLTIHADHAFWGANEEDAPLRFDAFALAAKRKGAAPLTMEDLAGVPYAPVTVDGATLPTRACRPSSAPPAGALAYDPKGAAFPDLRAFLADLQRAQGHLNGSGLCVALEP